MVKKTDKKVLSVMLCTVLMTALLPQMNDMKEVKAAIAGAFTVTGGQENTDYTYANGVLTIQTAAPVTIANTNKAAPTTDRIEVASNVSANITLAGVNIDVSGISNTAAFKIADNSKGNVTITLADGTNNVLKSGGCCAGLQKNGNASTGTLTICGNTGKLTATSGSYAAGIGGGENGSGSNITISGGTVTATGVQYGAGIGGGEQGSGSNIMISGGRVTATGGWEAAGIGGGFYGNGSDITISGGTVTATSGSYEAGIGGGFYGNGSNITISNSCVVANFGISGEPEISNSLVIQGKSGTVKGNATLDNALTIDADVTVKIGADAFLTVGENATLTNNGKIVNDGIIENLGTITGNGSIEGNPVIKGHDYQWRSNGDGTHTGTCKNHPDQKIENERCSGGEATDTQRAKCSVCGAEYGGYKEEPPATEPPATEPPAAEPPTAEQPDTQPEQAYSTPTKEEKEQNGVQLDKNTSLTWSKKGFVIQWGKVKGATHYKVFITACGTKYGKAVATVKAGSAGKKTVTKLNGKSFNKNKTYKAIVKAYRSVNGKEIHLGTSKTIHVVSDNNKKYTNAAKINVRKKTYKLKKGKTAVIKASIVKQNKKKKLLSSGHGAELRFISSNKKVATVTKKGKIKAKKKGTCYIYIQALNGLKKKVKVVVK